MDKKLKKGLIVIIFLIGSDLFLCLITIIIDSANYKGNKFGHFILNFLVFASINGITIYFLLKKRKKQFIIGGFTYLIGGAILWVYKMILFVYLIVSDKMKEDYNKVYNDSMYLLSFLINLLVIFLRLYAVYLMRDMFPDIEKLEEYIHERDHAELVQSLGTKGEYKLSEDEEITEENLYKKKNKNPFITGREKKEENEEEEINFDSTL